MQEQASSRHSRLGCQKSSLAPLCRHYLGWSSCQPWAWGPGGGELTQVGSRGSLVCHFSWTWVVHPRWQDGAAMRQKQLSMESVHCVPRCLVGTQPMPVISFIYQASKWKGVRVEWTQPASLRSQPCPFPTAGTKFLEGDERKGQNDANAARQCVSRPGRAGPEQACLDPRGRVPALGTGRIDGS